MTFAHEFDGLYDDTEITPVEFCGLVDISCAEQNPGGPLAQSAEIARLVIGIRPDTLAMAANLGITSWPPKD